MKIPKRSRAMSLFFGALLGTGVGLLLRGFSQLPQFESLFGVMSVGFLFFGPLACALFMAHQSRSLGLWSYLSSDMGGDDLHHHVPSAGNSSGRHRGLARASVIAKAIAFRNVRDIAAANFLHAGRKWDSPPITGSRSAQRNRDQSIAL